MKIIFFWRKIRNENFLLYKRKIEDVSNLLHTNYPLLWCDDMMKYVEKKFEKFIKHQSSSYLKLCEVKKN